MILTGREGQLRLHLLGLGLLASPRMRSPGAAGVLVVPVRRMQTALRHLASILLDAICLSFPCASPSPARTSVGSE
jgi:hypothetical protein